MKRIFFVLAMLAATCAWGSDNKGHYETRGIISCRKYVQARQEGGPEDTLFVGWITGYLTAYNMLKSHTYDIVGTTDIPSIELWLDIYCRVHPLSNVARGMDDLTVQLYPERTRVSPNR